MTSDNVLINLEKIIINFLPNVMRSLRKSEYLGGIVKEKSFFLEKVQFCYKILKGLFIYTYTILTSFQKNL